MPKRRDGVRAVPGAGGRERHRLQLHHLDRQRGRPRLYRFRPLPAGRSGYQGHRRLCRRLQAGRQVSRSGKARGGARQADRPDQDRAFGTGSPGGTLAYRGADRRGCPIRCGLCPIRGDPGPGLRRTAGGRAPAGPHPKAPSARHRGGVPLGRHQLADRRHVRSGRSRSAAAGGRRRATASTRS